jgi:Cys-tRNA(Pro) deacylase
MKTSVDVHNYLQVEEIPHEIFLINSPAKTAERTAALLGLNLDEVIKSVIFMAKDQPVLLILPGDRKASYKKVKEVLGVSKLRLASSREVTGLTGYVLGATPPLAHQTNLHTLIDQSVFSKDVLYTGGGEINALLKIRPQDLVRATEARVADISEVAVHA